jgi:hypothetical protein
VDGAFFVGHRLDWYLDAQTVRYRRGDLQAQEGASTFVELTQRRVVSSSKEVHRL